MAIKNGFFNSRDRDRTYNADDITSYLEGIVGNGVFPNPSTCLQVVENAGMTVSVNPGKSWIDGYWLKSNATFNVTIDQSDVTYDRKDRIVVKLDKEARVVSIAYKKGTPQQTATPPELVRNANVKEYSLATITVKKQTDTITQAEIHDDRADDSVCGYVKGLIEEIGTETLLLQYEAMWEQYFDKSTSDFKKWFGGLEAEGNAIIETIKTDYRNEISSFEDNQQAIFLVWFDAIKGQLSRDPAGNLQNQIDELDVKTDGFDARDTVFSSDGKMITETFGNKKIVTEFLANGQIVQKLYVDTAMVRTKTITFSEDGFNVQEEVKR